MPYVTPYGTFFHLPKTGGTWLQQVLSEQFGGVSRGGGHDPVWHFRWDDAFSRPGGKLSPTIGVIRDPWSWYGSLYRFALRGKRQGGIAYWGAALEQDWGKKTQFRAFLYGLTHPQEVPIFEPGSLGTIFELEDRTRMEPRLREGHQGFCSFVASYMFGTHETAGTACPSWEIDIILNQSDLRNGLKPLLGEIQEPHKPAANSSGHIKTEFPSAEYRTWYDEEMLSWVDRADEWFIREFSLQPFESTLSRSGE